MMLTFCITRIIHFKPCLDARYVSAYVSEEENNKKINAINLLKSP